MGSFLGIYKKLVVKYTRRSLTNGNDALDAFEEIHLEGKLGSPLGFTTILPEQNAHVPL